MLQIYANYCKGVQYFFYSYNTSLSRTRVKVKCVFGTVEKKNFQCLTKRPDYDPKQMVIIVQSVYFSCGIMDFCVVTIRATCQTNFVVVDQDDLDARIAASAGGRLIREIVCKYLWDHK